MKTSNAKKYRDALTAAKLKKFPSGRQRFYRDIFAAGANWARRYTTRRA